VSNVVHGRDPFAGFDNLGRTFLVTEIMSVAQFGIGEMGNGNARWEGSLPHLLLHGGLGCAAMEVMGGRCASGFFAGASQSVLAGSNLTDEQKLRLAPLVGGLAGFLWAEGQAVGVSFASTITRTGLINNYLTHADLAELEEDLARCERENNGRSCEGQAIDDIIEKFRDKSSDRDALLVADCARDMACVNDRLRDIATNSLGEWNNIQSDYWEVYTGLSDVIRPGELVTIHQAFLLEQVPLQNAFALDNCGGVWSPACENAYQLAAVESLLMATTLTGVGGLTAGAVRALVSRASVACGRDPRCWAGFLGREVGEEALSEVAAGGALVTGTVTFADEIASALRVAYRDAILAAPNRIPTPDRRIEIRELFDNNNPRSGIQIGNRSALSDPSNIGGAKVFDGVSDVEVKDYFMQLTGQPLPAPRTITIGGNTSVQLYTVRTTEGNFNLRSGSTSGVGRWTIDIPRRATGTGNAGELKFR
jgi:filamentous hemagglutinin